MGVNFMLCTVLGYTRLSGKSKKTGKDYDFFDVSVSYDAETGYTGRRVKELALDPNIASDIMGMMPPFNMDIQVDFSGRVLSVNFKKV